MEAHIHDPKEVKAVYLPPKVDVRPSKKRGKCKCGKKASWYWNDDGKLELLCAKCIIEEKLADQRESFEHLIAMSGVVGGDPANLPGRMKDGKLTSGGYETLLHVIVMTNKMARSARMEKEMHVRRMMQMATVRREIDDIAREGVRAAVASATDRGRDGTGERSEGGGDVRDEAQEAGDAPGGEMGGEEAVDTVPAGDEVG